MTLEMSTGAHYEALAKAVLRNLEYQHDWTMVQTFQRPGLSRPLICGLPPRRLYVHPDEQIEIIMAEKNREARIPQPPEFEWVLPIHLAEKMSIKAFAEVFDAIDAVPPSDNPDESSELEGTEDAQWMQWRGPKRGKRILLATVQDDSTVVYYLMHDGIVKPRQN